MNDKSEMAVLYARFSPRPRAKYKEEDEKLNSNKRQEIVCREYCQTYGYHVQFVFEDEHKSGYDKEREGLWSAVNSLKRGWILVVRDISRLARDVYLQETIKRNVRKAGARIEYVEGPRGDSPSDELIRGIIAQYNAYECKVIAARTKVAMTRYQNKDHRIMSKIVPFGYKRDPSSPKLFIPDEFEQETIDIMRTLSNEGGISLREIGRRLDEMGRKPRNGGKWLHNVISAILERDIGEF